MSLSNVITDAAPVCPGMLEELVPAAWHHVERDANNPEEADHGQLKRRLVFVVANSLRLRRFTSAVR